MIIMDRDRLYEYTTGDKFVAISGQFSIIGERAFAHGRMPVEFVVIPPTVTTVEEMAFYDCNEMFSIVIPGSVKKIGKKAFGYGIDGRIQGFRIYGEKGSEAERYAAENVFRFAVLYENAPSFDDYTLSCYKADKAARIIHLQSDLFKDITVPEINEEAERLIKKALDVFHSDCHEAISCLKKARYILSTMHMTEEQIIGLEPEPACSHEQDDALRQLAEIMCYVCYCGAADAAHNGDWQTAHDCCYTAYEALWLYHKPRTEKDFRIKRMTLKSLGICSLMLDHPAEALYWYYEEFDSIRDMNKNEENYRLFAECFERMSEALVAYGYLEAAEHFCGLAIELRRALIGQTEKGSHDDPESRDYLDRGFKAYDQFRIALLQRDDWRMQYACELLRDYRDGMPFLNDKEKDEITAEIEHIDRLAAEIELKRHTK